MAKFEFGETVRVKGKRVGSIDEFAVVRGVYENGIYWISNLNMPFAGTISDVVSENKIEKV